MVNSLAEAVCLEANIFSNSPSKNFYYLFEYFHSISWNTGLSVTVLANSAYRKTTVFSLWKHSRIFYGYAQCLCFSSFAFFFFKESESMINDRNFKLILKQHRCILHSLVFSGKSLGIGRDLKCSWDVNFTCLA